MAGRERVVEFAVKARDEYSKVLNNLEQQQKKLSAAAKASQRRATVGVAQGEIDAAVANYKRLSSEVDRYRAVQANAAKTGNLSEAEMRELGDAIKLVRDRSREAMEAIQQKRAALLQLNSGAEIGYAAFNRLASSIDHTAAETRGEGAAAGTTAAQLNKLTGATKTAAAAQGALKTKTDAASSSIRRQRSGGGAKGEAQDIAVWGLKPWQLTNLGYQVNDVVSGLAMGQKPLQIFSQQAGQFAQIWPQAMVAVARSVPIIAGVTAVLLPFAAAGKRLYDIAESVRIFSADLALSADGAKYNAEQLAQATEAMRKFGISTADARELVRQFVRDGFKTGQFDQLGQMAKQLDAITGEGVVAAGKRLSQAFSGSIDDVRKLDQELNFLTADQLSSIYTMKKAGDATGALSVAQKALADKLRASKGEASDWEQALSDLSDAWTIFSDVVGNSSVFKYMTRQLRLFGEDAKAVADVIKRAADAFEPGSGLEQAHQRLVEIDQAIATEMALRANGGLASGSAMSGEGNALEALKKQRQEVAAIIDQTRREQLEAIKDASQATDAATEREKKDRLDVQQIIDKQLETLTRETDQAHLTQREQFIQNELLKAKNAALEKAKQLGQDILGLTKEQTEQVRAQADSAYSAAHPNYEAQYTGMRGTASGSQLAQLVASVSELAVAMKLNSKDLLTAISYETGGTFNPAIRGGAGNQHVGLFQASPYNQQKYGINETSSVTAQIKAMGQYLTDAGVKAGDGLLQIYAAINAGNAKKINASDAKNGGMPGTVLDKVSEQMNDHAAKAEGLLAAFDGKLADKQAEYTKDLGERLTTAQQELDLAKKSNREAAIAKAVRDEELRAKKDGVKVSDEELAKVKAIAAAQFDQAHANDEVNRLVAQRTALFESLQIAQTAGDQGKVASVVDQISGVETKLTSAIAAAIAFWKAMGGPNADQAIADLQNLQDSIGQTLTKLDRQFLPAAQDINEQLAEVGSNAFSSFAQAIANGENTVDAFFNALRQGIAEFLIDIGKAIIKQALFNALSGGSGAGGSGGLGGAIVNGISAVFKHGGGPTTSGRRAMVNPMVFAGAQRFHNGGLPGLGPNEVPIIALKDEEVLTSDDPRHRANGGMSGTAVNVKNVNVFNPVDVMQAALSDLAGERVLINFLTRNAQKVSVAINS